nr:MAG TPA: hypothetical protein [Caudoviricetes sp.]
MRYYCYLCYYKQTIKPHSISLVFSFAIIGSVFSSLHTFISLHTTYKYKIRAH